MLRRLLRATPSRKPKADPQISTDYTDFETAVEVCVVVPFGNKRLTGRHLSHLKNNLCNRWKSVDPLKDWHVFCCRYQHSSRK